MIDRDADAAANLLERRWFSTLAAVRAMQAECEVLREVMQLAEESWRRARTQLAELESLRDALGDELACIDEQYPETSSPSHRPVMYAA
jgi:hypothetical protein